jgi:hypothetical protein
MAATLKSLMSSPAIQVRIFNLIIELEGYLRHPDFLALLHEATGASGSAFRFFMKGSNAVRMHVATSFPLPLASDFDMVLLIDPMLPAFRSVRAMLIQRLFEYFDAVVPKSAGFFDMPTLPAGKYSSSKRVYNGPLADDLPSYFDNVFRDKGDIPAPPTASFIYSFTNNLISPDVGGGHTSKGISLLKVVPRLPGGIDSIMDIIIPSRNYARIHYEWAATENLTRFNLMLGSQKAVVHLLDPFVLDADLRRSEATESRAEKLKTRREAISLLEISRLRHLL